MPSLISSMVVFGDSMSLRRSFGAGFVQSGLNDPTQFAVDRLVATVETRPDPPIEGGAGGRERLGHLGDRSADGAGDVEARLLRRGGGAPLAPAEPERCRQLG